MRNQLTVLIDQIINAVLLVTAFFIPLLFAPLTTEYYETPKLVFLISATSLMLVLWATRWVLQGKVSFSRSPLDVPLLLLLLIVIFSTFFSDSRNVSIYGSLPRIHGSAASWICYIIFYFIAVSQIKGKKAIRSIFYALLSSTILVALVTLLSYFGLYPLQNMFTFTKALNFSPAGETFSASAIILLMLPFPLLSIINPSKYLPLPAAIFVSTLFLLTLVLIAPLPILIATGLVIALIAFLNWKDIFKNTSPLLVIPVGVALFVLVLSSLPISNKLNPLQQKRQNFPQEIQLSFPVSWKVSASSFADAPFLGSGPATYLFDFTSYRPASFNTSKYWNLRFDTAFNEFMQALGTLGGLGFLALIFLSLTILAFARKRLQNRDDLFVSALSISAVAAVLLLVVHGASLVSIVITLLLLAMLFAAYRSANNKMEELTLGIQASKLSDSTMVSNLIVGDILPIIFLIPILFLIGVVGWWGQKAVLADVYHRKALVAANTNSLDTYNYLAKAEQSNPYIDLYRSDLAQTNFALANAIAVQKGPSQSSPSGSLTDTDKQNIQTLLSQSINEGKTATVLSPRNPQNWEILASIYRQISGVAQNALTFSLDAYGRAVNLDPYNPVLRLNVGGVYYSIKNYDLAIRFFTDAVNLKPDYANAYYNLSIALRDKGDLAGAQQAGSALSTLVDSKSPDYKVVSEYLADLKQRVATASANNQEQPAAVAPPVAEENGALQQKQLPKVLDKVLPQKPENIATPEAVKKEQ